MEFSRHRCHIYETSPAFQLPDLAAAIRRKRKENFRCLYLNSPAMVAGIRSYLAAAGIAVAAEVQRGSLVPSSDQGHLVEGRFDPDRMLALLAQTVDTALTDGYAGLWAAGDMTWEFGAEKNFTRLLEYERGLEELFAAQPALEGVCLYHTDTLPTDAVRDALHTHKAVWINDTLSHVNPYYLLSGEDSRPAKAPLETMLAHFRVGASS